jgi:hypothetical protein
MTRAWRNTAGVTLLETLVTILISVVVLSALLGVVVHQQRFYLMANDRAEVEGDLQRVELVVIPELLPLNPAAGDIVYAGDDSIATRVFRGVFHVCGKLYAPDFALVIRSLSAGAKQLNTDSVLVYSRGTLTGLSDDSWRAVKMTSVNATTCPDGAPGWRAVIPGLAGVASEIPVGAPVRAYRHGSYWLESGADGWYLKTNATSGTPVLVAGPLTPPDADPSTTLRFRYLDTEGDPAATSAEIAQIDIDVASQGSVPGRDGAPPHRSTLRLSFDVRNN